MISRNKRKYENEKYGKISMPMIRRTFPKLFANSLDGVQPISKPAGLAFAMRHLYGRSEFADWMDNHHKDISLESVRKFESHDEKWIEENYETANTIKKYEVEFKMEKFKKSAGLTKTYKPEKRSWKRKGYWEK